VTIGIIGCGNISAAYLKRLTEDFSFLEVTACADLAMNRARSRAEEYGIAAVAPDELLADPETELILNLTPPAAHAPLCRRILESGRHAYVEKPLATALEDGRELVALASRRGLRLGCAPDTFLGGGCQTCRSLIDRGAVGKVAGAAAFMLCPGHESWHPSPEFYYQVGGGPLFDMGPYYLTALVSLLGPAKAVTAMTSRAFETRTIGSEPKRGTVMHVEVPTHYAGTVEFEGGVLATVVMSFDTWSGELPFIEIYGTEGTLSVPNPNIFGGPVRLRRGRGEWEEIPIDSPFVENYRGLGVAELVDAAASNRPHRASGELACHVLEIMTSFGLSAERRAFVELESSCPRPEPFDGRSFAS